jgi:serpin B
MKQAFQRGKADFSGMIVGDLPVSLARVRQQATVVVDEEGAEAAAVADVKGKAKGKGPRSEWVTFRADRPFLFLIRHRDTGAILFLGRVTNPAG